MHYGKCVQSALKPALGAILTIMLAVGLAPAVAIAAESTSGGGGELTPRQPSHRA